MNARNHRRVALCLLLCTVCIASVRAQVDVTTYHNDNSRTGANTRETTLTPANVNSTQFGRLFTVALDGTPYAQPLYLSNLEIANATHNVVFAETQHDSVYAIDANTGALYWQRSLIPAGGSTVSSGGDLNCGDIATEVGITGTPVIDQANGTLYVVAKVKLQGVISQYLHALDVGTGAEKFGGPVLIHATVSGAASDGHSGTVTFNAKMENQRAALLLENGHVIVTWSSHCDNPPWHGWVMSYAAGNLTQESVYNATRNGLLGGIWMSGGGPAADTSGNILLATGNGTWDGNPDLSESIIKLGPPANGTFPVLDYFTPYNQASLTSDDQDVSAGGLVLLPALSSGQELLTLISKQGSIYLVDRNNMGKYCGTTPGCTSSDTNIVQEVPKAFVGYWGSPAYWNGNLYWGGGDDNTDTADFMKAFSFNANGSGKISTMPTSSTAERFFFAGPVPSVSANGAVSGIVWALDNGAWQSSCASSGANCQILYAYDASNLRNLLYTSNQAANHRDLLGSAVKFTTPTIANGKVYVGSRNSLSAFGLLGSAPDVASPPSFSPVAGTYTAAPSVVLSDSTPGATIYYTTDGSKPTTSSTRYSAPLKISSTTTVRAIAAASGFVGSGVVSATYTIAAGGSTALHVNLGSALNVDAVTEDGARVANGGMDGAGDAYSGVLLGSSVTWGGSTFSLPAPGTNSGLSEATITIPQGNYTTLQLLATGVHGNQVNQTFIVTYTDGTTTTLTQSLSDWFAPQGYPGEAIAVTMPYRISANGSPSNIGPFYLYGYSFALSSSKAVKSVTLPGNRSVIVLAVDLIPSATQSPPPPNGPVPVSFAGVANVHGIFRDGTAVTDGGIDTFGDAYSSGQLGASITWSGTTFTLGGAGAADAVSKTTVSLPAGNYSKLQLLATGAHGNQLNQTFTITYSDGTTSAVTQSLSDWFTPQGYPGESKAATTAYRLLPNGSASSNGPFYLYAYAFALNSSKAVKSVTLPGNREVVVLALALVP